MYFYNYILNRASPGENYPIGFGVAYHTYREVLEQALLTERRIDHEAALAAALKDFDEPPEEHRYSYLNAGRLRLTCEVAFEIWKREKAAKRVVVLEAEQSFDLILPSGRRFGGRFDQVVEWNKKLWVRDFKTTSRKLKNWSELFAVDHQPTGYTWAANILSGRPIQGAIIELVHNTKTINANFDQAPITRSPGQITQWLSSLERELDDIERNVALVEDLGYLAFPQRSDSCKDFGGCFWLDACSKDGAYMIDRWIENETVYSEWDFMAPKKEKGVAE